MFSHKNQTAIPATRTLSAKRPLMMALAGVTAVLGSLTIANNADAANLQFHCASTENRLARCETGVNVKALSMTQQHSRSSCTPGRDFGFQGSTVWARNGCRADFVAYHGKLTPQERRVIRSQGTQASHQAAPSNSITPGQGIALVGGALVVAAILSSLADEDSNATVTTNHSYQGIGQPQPVTVHQPYWQPNHQHQANANANNGQSRVERLQGITRQALRQQARQEGFRGAQVRRFTDTFKANGQWYVSGVGQYNAKAANPGPRFRFTAAIKRGQVQWIDKRPVRRQQQNQGQYRNPYQGGGYQGGGWYSQNSGWRYN